MRRFPVIGHAFHHTLRDIDEMDLAQWVQLARAHDEYVEETKRHRARRRR